MCPRTPRQRVLSSRRSTASGLPPTLIDGALEIGDVTIERFGRRLRHNGNIRGKAVRRWQIHCYNNSCTASRRLHRHDRQAVYRKVNSLRTLGRQPPWHPKGNYQDPSQSRHGRPTKRDLIRPVFHRRLTTHRNVARRRESVNTIPLSGKKRAPRSSYPPSNCVPAVAGSRCANKAPAQRPTLQTKLGQNGRPDPSSGARPLRFQGQTSDSTPQTAPMHITPPGQRAIGAMLPPTAPTTTPVA